MDELCLSIIKSILTCSVWRWNYARHDWIKIPQKLCFSRKRESVGYERGHNSFGRCASDCFRLLKANSFIGEPFPKLQLWTVNWIITIIVWRFNHKQTFMAFVESLLSFPQCPWTQNWCLMKKCACQKHSDNKSDEIRGCQSTSNNFFLFCCENPLKSDFTFYAHVRLLFAAVV